MSEFPLSSWMCFIGLSRITTSLASWVWSFSQYIEYFPLLGSAALAPGHRNETVLPSQGECSEEGTGNQWQVTVMISINCGHRTGLSYAGRWQMGGDMDSFLQKNDACCDLKNEWWWLERLGHGGVPSRGNHMHKVRERGGGSVLWGKGSVKARVEGTCWGWREVKQGGRSCAPWKEVLPKRWKGRLLKDFRQVCVLQSSLDSSVGENEFQ